MFLNKSKTWWASCGCSIGAAIAFFVFAHAAINDRSATATSAAAFCLALTFIAAFDLESIEGLGIKAKLKNTLNEAEARLQQINSVTITLTKFAFLQAARSFLRLDERQALVRELTIGLKQSEMTDQEIADISSPFMDWVTNQFWYIFTLIRSSYMTYIINVVSIRANSAHSLDGRMAEQELISRLTNSTTLISFPTTGSRNLRELMTREVENMIVLEGSHRNIIQRFVDELAGTYEQCVLDKNLTNEAIDRLHLDGPNSSGSTIGSRIIAAIT